MANVSKIKTCTKCSKELELKSFHKDKKTSDGYTKACKDCRNNLRKFSKSSFIYRIYSAQKSSSKQRGRPMPSYSRDELVDWFMNQQKFHRIYEEWQKSNFEHDLSPSCDRIDSKKPYSLDNIQLMTWAENNYKGRFEKKSEKPRKARVAKEKPVAMKVVVDTSERDNLRVSVYKPDGSLFIRSPIKTKIPKEPIKKEGSCDKSFVEKVENWQRRCITKLDSVIRRDFSRCLYGDVELVVKGLA